jgi:hypothetical protein
MTLVELAVALLVLSVVIVPATYLIATSNQVVGASRVKDVESALANSTLDDIRAAFLCAATSGTGGPGGLCPPWPPAPFGPLVPPAWVNPAESNGSGTDVVTVGSVNYLVRAAGGWCDDTTNDNDNDKGSEPDTDNPPTTYWVLVSVVVPTAKPSTSTATLWPTGVVRGTVPVYASAEMPKAPTVAAPQYGSSCPLSLSA